ncbi:hypothetical protein M0Q50_10695 [bacterium]|jgi:hypothetical protein|nr:hypothetical protein [bacterium]
MKYLKLFKHINDKTLFNNIMNYIKPNKNSIFDDIVKNYNKEEIINMILDFSDFKKENIEELNKEELRKIWNILKIDDKLDDVTK